MPALLGFLLFRKMLEVSSRRPFLQRFLSANFLGMRVQKSLLRLRLEGHRYFFLLLLSSVSDAALIASAKRAASALCSPEHPVSSRIAFR